MSECKDTHMNCRALVDLLSDYVEGNMDESTKAHMDEHFHNCPECDHFFDEFRKTIKFTSECFETTRAPEIPLEVKDRLLNFAEKLEKQK